MATRKNKNKKHKQQEKQNLNNNQPVWNTAGGRTLHWSEGGGASSREKHRNNNPISKKGGQAVDKNKKHTSGRKNNTKSNNQPMWSMAGGKNLAWLAEWKWHREKESTITQAAGRNTGKNNNQPVQQPCQAIVNIELVSWRRKWPKKAKTTNMCNWQGKQQQNNNQLVWHVVGQICLTLHQYNHASGRGKWTVHGSKWTTTNVW